MMNTSPNLESEVAGAAQQALSTVAEVKLLARRRPYGRSRQADDDETALVARLKQGDPDALEVLFNRFSAKLYNVARRVIGEGPDIEEVIQDVFWTAYRRAKTFRGTAQFSTWLYRLTLNAALGQLRRNKRKREVPYDEFLPKFAPDGHHRLRPVVDWSNTLEEQYAQHERHRFVTEALDDLRPLDKSVVVLSDLEGLADKEIAAILGVTVSAVKTRLHRARLFLRGRLAVRLGHAAS